MQSPYLKIQHLQKHFGSYRALHNISLQIEEGEFVCFLGPSGCGKTTLLRAIAGLEPADGGCIVQGGRDVSALAPSLRDFGIVFQSYALFPNLSVAENVGYGLVNSKIAKAQRRERVAALLQQVDLPGIEDKFPAQLSGGQQQRVALARALAMEPGLLLLDEPLSALDARVRQHLRSEICQLQRKLGITTIMVTHDQEEALTMADRIVVMNAGEIVQQGTPQQIYQRPVNAFVANFIGSMNLLDVALLNASTVLVGGVEYRLDEPVGNGAHSGQLGFRPECVKLGLAQGGNLALKGVVSARIFMGAFSRLRIALDHLSIELDVGSAKYAELEL
ncbi:MAG: putative 2-aminoethylphosphonate ABC transporter ATP-binding protein, partial [Pseudomonadales bacterium]